MLNEKRNRENEPEDLSFFLRWIDDRYFDISTEPTMNKQTETSENVYIYIGQCFS